MEMKKNRSNNTHTFTHTRNRHTPLDNEPSDQKGTGNAEVNQLKPFLGLEKTTTATLCNILDIRLGGVWFSVFILRVSFPVSNECGWLRFSTPSSAALLHTRHIVPVELCWRAGRPSSRIDIPVWYCLGKCTLKGVSSFFILYATAYWERKDGWEQILFNVGR